MDTQQTPTVEPKEEVASQTTPEATTPEIAPQEGNQDEAPQGQPATE